MTTTYILLAVRARGTHAEHTVEHNFHSEFYTGGAQLWNMSVEQMWNTTTWMLIELKTPCDILPPGTPDNSQWNIVAEHNVPQRRMKCARNTPRNTTFRSCSTTAMQSYMWNTVFHMYPMFHMVTVVMWNIMWN